MRLMLTAIALAALTPAAHAHDIYGHGCESCDAADGRSAEALAFESRVYRRFESPSVERRIRSEIAYSEARIDSIRDLLVDYGRVNRFSTGSALAWSADRARLDLRREEMIRRDLQDQLILQRRHARRGKQVRAYAVERANVAATQRAAVGEPRIEITTH